MLSPAPATISTPSAAPWTNVYGAARSLLAFGLLVTLTSTGRDVLFDGRLLDSMARTGGSLMQYNLFVVLRDHLMIAKLVAILVLLVTASGWRPRWTALPHWWVAVSFGSASRVPDGGDHIHIVLSSLLLGVALTDRRRWHWQTVEEPSPPFLRQVLAFIASSSLVVIGVQMAVVYFHAAVGKMAVAEWADGTAVYYWFTDPALGAPPWLAWLLEPILASSVGVLTLTWGTLALELSFCFAPLLPARYRRWFLVAGIAFHAGIVLVHGLVSFFFSMAAGLILLLRRPHERFALPMSVTLARVSMEKRT